MPSESMIETKTTMASAPPEREEHRILVPTQLHFLVVDDQAPVRYVVARLLNALGHHRVSEAEDGEKALVLLRADHAAETPCNFVVTDWNMPVMDGLTLLKTIRASAALQDLPVLMITSVAEQESISAVIRAGANDYILKSSLSAAILRQAISRILMKRRLSSDVACHIGEG